MKRLIFILLIIIGFIQIGFSDISFCENCITIHNDTGEEPFSSDDIINIERKKKIVNVKTPILRTFFNYSYIDYKTKRKEIDIDQLPKDKFKLQKLKLKSNLTTKEQKYIKNYPVYEIAYCDNISSYNCIKDQKLIGYYDLEKGIDYEFEKGKNYKFGENSITWDAGGFIKVQANSTHNLFTMADIYNADQTNGWGCFISGNTKYNQYVWNGSKCYIKLGGSPTYTTYLNDTDLQVLVIADVSITGSGAEVWIVMYQNTEINFGIVHDESTKKTSNGLHFRLNKIGSGWLKFMTDAGGVNTITNLYSSNFDGSSNGDMLMQFRSGRIWNVRADGDIHASRVTGMDIYNYIVTDSNTLLRIPDESTTATNLFGAGVSSAIWCQSLSGAGKDVTATGHFRDMYISNLGAADRYCKITNYEIGPGRVTIYSTNPNGVQALFYNEMDLLVYDENNNLLENALVTITANNETIVYNNLTNSEGSINTQELLQAKIVYNNSGTTTDYYYNNGDWDTSMTPYTIEINKEGYTTYRGLINPDKKQRLTITMQRPIFSWIEISDKATYPLIIN